MDVEEQAVAAQGHDDVAVVGVDQVVASGELGLGRPAWTESDATQAMRGLATTKDMGYPPTPINASTPEASVGSAPPGNLAGRVASSLMDHQQHAS